MWKTNCPFSSNPLHFNFSNTIVICLKDKAYGKYKTKMTPSLPWIMASNITITKKKNVMSNIILKASLASPSAGSISSPGD